MPKTNAVTWFFFSACISAGICCQPQQENEKAPLTAERSDTVGASAATPLQPQTADQNDLKGNWVRTDAPYNLVIAEVLESGNLKAEYLNPESINVAKAEWAAANGVIQIYIELRDTNYPGSNYRLTYYPANGALSGKYFQAVEGITYDVEFMKVKLKILEEKLKGG